MSIKLCITGKADAGVISREAADEAIRRIDEIEKAGGSVDVETRRQAYASLVNDLDGEKARKKFLLLKNIEARSRIETAVKEHPGGVINGLLATLSRDWKGKASNLNVDKLREGIRGVAHSMFLDGLTELKSKRIGLVRNVDLAKEVVRAMNNETDNPLAIKIAKQFNEVSEYLRNRFNAAGGDIPKLEIWKIPQVHDSRLINAVSAREWVDFVTPLLDRKKMINYSTGWPPGKADLDGLLLEAYETLRTNGLNKMTPGQAHRTSLANKYRDSRVLHFKDADSWLKYNQTFGNNDVYSCMTSYIDNMANDIAFLEIWGPNPEYLKQFMIDSIRKEASLSHDFKYKDGIENGLKRFENLWDDVSGTASTPVSARIAKFGSETRSFLITAQLGSAFLSGMSDIVTNTLTARFNGLSQLGLVKNIFKLLKDKEYQGFAVQLGLVADGWAKIAGTSTRYAGEIMQRGRFAKGADVLMKASLLEPWTNAGQWAFGLEFTGMLGRSADKTFDRLPKDLQQTFGRYGLTAADWDIIRASPLDDYQGAKFVNIANLARSGRDNLEVASKLQNMILTERDFAVITSDPRVRALLYQGTRAGTMSGEVARFVGMYKAFPITMLTTHFMRGLSQETLTSRAAYMASLFVPMTLFGALAFQAKQVVRGKEPVPMDSWKFWLGAASQGGGAGILGDFLFSEQNRFGGGLATTLAGPAAGFFSDVWNLTAENAKQLAAGEDTNFGSEAVNFFGRYTPGSSLWYTRLAFERFILDQAALAADSKARKRFRRIIRKQEKDYKSGYYWKPGELKPNF